MGEQCSWLHRCAVDTDSIFVLHLRADDKKEGKIYSSSDVMRTIWNLIPIDYITETLSIFPSEFGWKCELFDNGQITRKERISVTSQKWRVGLFASCAY